jgi:putative oxidoreductase
LQRLFSNFADGWPGTGILLLRLLAGSALVERGMVAVNAEAHTALGVLQIVAAGAGILILAGLWTPVVGVLAGIAEACTAFLQPDSRFLPIMLASLVVSLAMIGPGALSIDARLYGRKQILPPEL